MKHDDEDNNLRAIADAALCDMERRGLVTSIVREDGEIIFVQTELGKQRAEQLLDHDDFDEATPNYGGLRKS
jgi:hypothetical protein